MIINQIIYTAKGEVAGLDDIITLRLNFYDRAGGVIGTSMISGHSNELSGSVYEIEPLDIDSIRIEATDLDYSGHTLKFNNYEYDLPKTGSQSQTFRIEPVGAPTVTQVTAPDKEKFLEVTKLPMPGAEVPPGFAMPLAIGSGALALLAVIVLAVVLGRRKNR